MKLNLLNILRKSYGQPSLEEVKIIKQYKFFATGDYNIYFNKGYNNDKIDKFFKQYNYEIKVLEDDNSICIKSLVSDDFIQSEYCVTGKEYNNYLLEYEEDLKEDDPDNLEKWKEDLEKMKKFDSYYMVKSTSEIESKYIILYALYLLETNNDVLVFDTFNGIYLDKKKLKEIEKKI